MSAPDPARWLRLWALAFGLTQLVEAPIYLWGQRGLERSFGRKLGVALLPSGLTHPLLWLGLFAWLSLAGRPSRAVWWSAIAAAELLIVALEGAVLRAAGLRRPLLLALLANGASFGLGLLIEALRR